MGKEQGISPRVEKCLRPGHKLLLAGPNNLVAIALSKLGEGSVLVKPAETNPDNIMKQLTAILSEYYSIYSLLVRIVGKENVIVVRNELIVGKNTEPGIVFREIPLPEELEFGAVDIHHLSSEYKSWPRGAHTVLGDGRVLVKPGAWMAQGRSVEVSPLADGGKILTRGKAVLLTADLWELDKEKILGLRRSGFSVGRLPLIDFTKQLYLHSPEDDIDGHAALIEDNQRKLALVVARSYYRQHRETRRGVRRAAREINAEIYEVFDWKLPPYALNLLQFEDRTIAMTGPEENNELYSLLVKLVGKDKVFTTEVPLNLIPKYAGGGIRCLTNIISPSINLGLR